MIVTVRHLSKEASSTFSSIESADERLAFAKDQLIHNNYFRVADISCKVAVESVTVWLEEAYALTNSVDSPWFMTDISAVDVERSALNGCRSTTMGDIIQIQGNSYMVAEFGFLFLQK